MRTGKEHDATEDSTDPIPEGWEMRAIADVCVVNPPKPPVGALPPSAYVTFVPMPAVDSAAGAITSPERKTFSEVRNGHTAFQNGDVLFAKITPCMENGKAAVARGMENGIGFGSTEFHVLRPKLGANADFLYYFIRQESFRKAAEDQMTGSVGQKRVPVGFVKTACIPMPPFAEQCRIVARVEDLLAHVAAARERLRLVRDILRGFRRTALAAVCSGRLTEDWRDKHPNVEPASDLLERLQSVKGSQLLLWTRQDSEEALPELPDTWVWSKAGELFADARYGTSTKCISTPGDGVPVLRVPNISAGRLDLSNLKYGSLSKTELRSLTLEHGDVLVCRTNGSMDLIGKAAVVGSVQTDYAFASYLIRLRTHRGALLPEYLHTILTAPIGREQIEAKARTTAGQFNLNLRILGNLKIPIPPLDEQRELVRRVEALFSLADAIEKRTVATEARVVRLTQAILAKAFRGELVPTEAELARREGRAYESASELLEYRRERETVANKPRSAPSS